MMPLQDILASIASEADREVDAVRVRAEQEAQAVLARADAEVAALGRQCEARRQKYVDTVVARILHTARLDAIRRVHGAREEVVARVLGEVRAALGGLRDRPGYDVVLARWLAEVRAALPEGDRLRVAPADEALARTLAPDLAVEADPDVPAGLALVAPDGRTAVATPSVRLDRAEPAIRQAVALALAR